MREGQRDREKKDQRWREKDKEKGKDRQTYCRYDRVRETLQEKDREEVEI